MKLFNKLGMLLLLAGFLAPVQAAVEGIDTAACTVYSDEKSGDKKAESEEEEEPDCE